MKRVKLFEQFVNESRTYNVDDIEDSSLKNKVKEILSKIPNLKFHWIDGNDLVFQIGKLDLSGSRLLTKLLNDKGLTGDQRVTKYYLDLDKFKKNF